MHPYSFTAWSLDGDSWSKPDPGHFTPKEAPVPIVEEDGWGGLRAGLDGYGVRSSDKPVRGVSLYLLRYPGNRPIAE